MPIPWMSWSLRTRITVWYVVLVAATLAVFSVYLHIRLEDNLRSQLDSSIEIASAQAFSDMETSTGRMVFGDQLLEISGEIASISPNGLVLGDGTSIVIGPRTEVSVVLAEGQYVEIDALETEFGLAAHEISAAKKEWEQDIDTDLVSDDLLDTDEFIFRIVDGNGFIHHGMGDYWAVDFPIPDVQGFLDLATANSGHWRVHNLPLTSEQGGTLGWLQTAASMEGIDDALESLRTQLYLAVPLAIGLAGLGGFFLADRGLRPIGRITRIAQSITGSAMNRRIDFKGPEDEVGRLATTFDSMLDRLESAFEREKRFIADASHELRTPLTALKGKLDVTLGSHRTPDEYRRTMQDMNGEVDRLIRVSNELLYLARLEQGHLSWQPTEISLKHLLASINDQLGPLAESKSVTLVEDIPSEMRITGDPDHLIRLFLNIMDNAVKFSPPGAVVSVHAEQRDGKVDVSVTDEGPGISSEHLAHILERFYRVDKARSREEGGTGLGLAIASEIAQRHGGSIDAQSNVGVGTTVTVTLPKGTS
ncbi:MAG: ATP-binding protein [Chloroflexi bacterium]|nr:ATP-binding protein [Chloroflexota bacterium]MDA1227049.1 ATP-binding protein [Chloroflexota bacterium]